MAWPQPWPRAIGQAADELDHEQIGRLQTGYHAHWLGGAWQNKEQESPLPAAIKKPRRWQGRDWNQGCNQAWDGVLKGAAMRLRRRRLQPKAAPAPSRGRGPGTAALGGPEIKLIVSLAV